MNDEQVKKIVGAIDTVGVQAVVGMQDGYGKKHFTFTPPKQGPGGFIWAGSLYIDSEPTP